MQTIKKLIKVSDGEFSQEFCLWADSCRLLQEALREKAKAVAENEKLREIFEFATLEFEKRNRRIALLEEELKEKDATIKELRQENEKLQKRIEELEARNNLLNKMAFGRKSEKKETEKLAVVETKRRGAVRGHTGHGRKIPENLPEREEIIDLPEDKKFCSFCGKPYIEIGLEEVSCQVGVEKIYYLKKIKRKVYKKTCSCQGSHCNYPGSCKNYSQRKILNRIFPLTVLINKYKNHLPVERQIFETKEYRLDISLGTIFGALKEDTFPLLKAII